MKIILLQLIMAAIVAMPQVHTSCGGAESCCKMSKNNSQERGSEITHRDCCCGVGKCSGQKEPYTMARMVHSSENISIQAPAVISPLFINKDETCYSLRFASAFEREQQRGYPSITRLLCVIRC